MFFREYRESPYTQHQKPLIRGLGFLRRRANRLINITEPQIFAISRTGLQKTLPNRDFLPQHLPLAQPNREWWQPPTCL